MRTKSCAFALLAAAMAANAFTTSQLPSSRTTLTTVFEYVPDGFTMETWKAYKTKEAEKQKTKNLGRMGPKGFKSRSFRSFQEALERGEAAHLMPEFNAKERVKRGELKVEDIPYMQRGGSWDNSDVQGARNRKKWLDSDKTYASGGYRREQSYSIFGYGEGLDWTGQRARTGPMAGLRSESVMGAAPKFARNYQAPNVYKMGLQKKDDKEPKKKLFGLF